MLIVSSVKAIIFNTFSNIMEAMDFFLYLRKITLIVYFLLNITFGNFIELITAAVLKITYSYWVFSEFHIK